MMHLAERMGRISWLKEISAFARRVRAKQEMAARLSIVKKRSGIVFGRLGAL
jgi:hypothetical protein